MDYPKAETIINKGAAAAQAKQQILGPYSMNDAAWSEYLQARTARKQTDVPVPQFVKVEGTDPSTAKQHGRISCLAGGQADRHAKLDKLLTRLTGLGKFDWAGYQIASRDGRTGWSSRCTRKIMRRPICNLDLRWTVRRVATSALPSGAADVQDKAGYRSEWRTDLLFGNTYGIASELYRH